MFKNKYSIISTIKCSTIEFNVLPLNLIDLYLYGYQILDSFISINEFAWIRCTVYQAELHGINSAELFDFG